MNVPVWRKDSEDKEQWKAEKAMEEMDRKEARVKLQRFQGQR